ncbi:ABC transporter permease [Feifania hominis]|uniref:ABC transporter permease n=1 Tax=Feifania hominis TaxID=2763660 RepID=A0A926HTQ8_9FIRM|nr:ABC transporter permease [Feifania hominis]MBC8536119.1 ABC transporter permease [Feifania hominis]
MQKIKQLASKDRHLTRLFAIFLVVTAVMCILEPELFLSVANFKSMSLQFPELGFLSIAAALVMMSGGIDLSVTGTAMLSGIAAALIMKQNGGSEASVGVVLLAILAALAMGVVCGLINATLVARVGIVPMLATLGTMNLFTGAGIILTKGTAVTGFSGAFLAIGNGEVLGVPVPLILFVIAIGVLAFFLNRTKLGYKLCVYGTNPTASFYSAINNTKVVFSTYLVSGIVSSVAGIIMVSRVNTARADFGSSYGLQALLVAVLGGINPSGGGGRASGILLSIITLQFVSSGFNILRIDSVWKDLTWGALLVGIMVLNTVGARRRPKKKPVKEG